jgi:hypothetical protein
LGGATAAEGQGALNALGMDCSTCGFDHARSRPAMTIKGAKTTVYYPKIWYSLQR